MSKKRIMIVEDEWIIANDIKVNLLEMGYDVCCMVDSGEDAIIKAEEVLPDLALMDIHLAGEMDGMQAAVALRERFQIPVVYLTAHADERILHQAKLTEPFGYLLKPFENKELRFTIEISIYKNKMEKDLLAAKERAEEATKLKDKFISLVSHDLRNPLTALQASLKLLQMPGFKQEAREKIVASATKSVDRLMNLTQELLDVSRFKTGKIRTRSRFLYAKSMVAQTVTIFEQMAQEKNILLDNQIPENKRIYADKILFGEVLSNLLSNSIKFSNSGSTVEIYMPDSMSTTIAISDQGQGIKSELQEDIFNYEAQTSTIGTSGERGSGLGLPLAMDIVKAHGGELKFDSAENKGTTFFAELPNVSPKILLVEDDEPTRKLIMKMLDELGANIEVAEDGKDAMKKINLSKPHLILSDVYMPEVDGFELLDFIRNEKDLKGIPFIILTVDHSMELRQKAFRHNADDFINKPISKEELLPRVEKYLL